MEQANDFVDRFRHPMRRRRAADALRALDLRGRSGLVLFLCQGNICRSPFAEATFRREVAHTSAAGLDATSAGLVVPNRASPPEALSAASAFGVDLSGHRSRLLTQDLIQRASVAVVMSPRQVRAIRPAYGRAGPAVFVLGDFDETPIDSRTIRDPWGELPDAYVDAYMRIDRCVRYFVRVATSEV